MADYVIICVDHSGIGVEHLHVERIGVQAIPDGRRRILNAREVRRLMTLGVNRYFIDDSQGRRVPVSLDKCDCGRKAIRLRGTVDGSSGLLITGPCND